MTSGLSVTAPRPWCGGWRHELVSSPLAVPARGACCRLLSRTSPLVRTTIEALGGLSLLHSWCGVAR
eukprot:2646448-Alexandrium_andersonii.AAC.1